MGFPPRLTNIDQAARHLDSVAAISKTQNFKPDLANRTVNTVIRILETQYMGEVTSDNKAYLNDFKEKMRPTFDKMQNSIKMIRQNQVDFSTDSKLKILADEIDMLARVGVIKKVFYAEHVHRSLPEHLQRPFKYIFELLTRKIAGAITKQVYRGWSQKIKNEKIKEAVEQEYKEKYENWYKVNLKKAQTDLERQRVQDVYDEELVDLPEEVAEHEDVKPIAAIEAKGIETRELFMAVGGERVKLITSDKKELDGTYLSGNEFKHCLRKQDGGKVDYTFPSNYTFSGISLWKDDPANDQTMIQHLFDLGVLSGKDLSGTIKTGSGYGLLYDGLDNRWVIASKIDLQKLAQQNEIRYDANAGFYMFSNQPTQTQYRPIFVDEELRQDLLNKGATLKEIHVKGEKTPIPAFSYPIQLKPCPEHLIGMDISVRDHLGNIVKSEWCYMKKNKAEDLIRSGKLDKNFQWKNIKDVQFTDAKNINEWKFQDGGVAILSSGNAGVYEMHKSEALLLLLKGMDVFLVNLSGYGGSKGKPTLEGSYNDLRAALDFVRHQCKGIADSQVVAWSLCLSGGIAARLAEENPHINLFLNQTYAEFWNILKANIETQLDEFFKKHIYSSSDESKLRAALKACLLPIISAAVKLVAPNYNVKNRLPKVQGQVCIMRAKDDTLMTQQETAQMQKAVEGKGNVTFVEIPGGHCSPWNQLEVYTTQTGEEIVRKDYYALIPMVPINPPPPIFIHSNDLVKGFTSTAPDGTVYYYRYDNDNHVMKCNYIYGGNPHEIIYQPSEITDDLLPQFMNNRLSDPEYVGHKQVDAFLSEAKLDRPLI